ncbi:LMBR1-like conserved region family protein [Cryptosporidium serpentis]
MLLVVVALFDIAILVVLVWIFLLNVTSKQVQYATISFCYIGILASLLPIALLPLDIGITILDVNSNGNLNSIILRLWRILYILLFVLCWIVYPILFEYEMCGEFNWKCKLKTSLRRNRRFWLIQLTCFILLVLFCVLIFQKYDLQTILPLICIAGGHIWGMIQITLLWGFGLISVPKYIKNIIFSDKFSGKYKLDNLYISLYTLDDCRAINQHETDQLKNQIYYLYTNLTDRRLRDMLSIIIKSFNFDLNDLKKSKLIEKWEIDKYRIKFNPDNVSLETIIELNRLLKITLAERNRIENQWFQILDECWKLEDKLINLPHSNTIQEDGFLLVGFNQQNNKFKHELLNSQKFDILSNKNDIEYDLNDGQTSFYMRKCVRRYINYFVFIITVILSFSIIIAEAGIYFQSINLSLFSYILNLISKSNFIYYPIKILLVELICIILLLYLYLCTYWVLWSIKLPKKYGIYFHNQTDGSCLVFLSQFMCKLATALCFHYLALIRVNGTTFDTFYGKPMHFLPRIVGNDFNSMYFPLFVTFLSIINALNLQQRFMKSTGLYCLFFDYYGIEELYNMNRETMSSEFNAIIADGKRIADSQRRIKNNEQDFQDI